MMEASSQSACVKCEEAIEPEMEYCPKCGSRQQPSPGFCSHCGSPFSENAQFCPKCGCPAQGVKLNKMQDRAHHILLELQSVASKLTNNPKKSSVVIAAVVLLSTGYAAIRPHTNQYVFEQHPMYQANMTTFTNVGKTRNVDYEWPYEGHEDRLKAIFHGDSYGSPSTVAPPTKQELDQAALVERIGFASIRLRSGFDVDDSMKCQAYVEYENGSDVGYNGPETNPQFEDSIKSRLSQVR